MLLSITVITFVCTIAHHCVALNMCTDLNGDFPANPHFATEVSMRLGRQQSFGFFSASLCTATSRAIELGESEIAGILMNKGADPLKTCHRFVQQTTPLHKAIQLGDQRFVKSFVELI